MRLALAHALPLLIATAAGAHPVRIVVETSASLEGAAQTTTLRARNAHSATAKTVDVQVTVPGTTTLDLPDGSYVIESTDAPWWIEPQLVTVRGATALNLSARRTGSIVGTLNAAATGVSPAIRFREDRFSGEAQCVVRDSEFRCVAPEGTFDVRVAIPGHVPHYQFGVTVAAGKTHNLDSMSFVAGASLAGQVETKDERVRGATVLLERTGGTAKISIPVADHGFFSHGPMTPGDYTLTAVQKGLISAPVPVTIRPGMEAALREPLLLAKPKRVEVQLSPPATPSGTGWFVQLSRLVPGVGPAVVAEAPASPDGSWSANQLPPGDYQLTVRPQGGPVWHAERLPLSDAVTWVPVTLKGVRFRGKVRLGDQPLSAQLIFGGEYNEHRIPWRSDEQGEFKGYLPAAPQDGWMVTVKSDSPTIKTSLSNVLPAIDAISGEAFFDLRLPDTTIEGIVVDEKGSPTGEATINVSSRDPQSGLLQVDVDKDGRFVLRGLPADTYKISADAYLRESDTVEVVLKPEETSATQLRLALKPYRQWRGRVATPNGRAVTDAKLHAIPVDVAVTRVFPAHTDADGRFTALVPADAKLFEVRVQPVGYSFRMFRQVLTDELNVVVEARGGTLNFDMPDDPALTAALWHHGAWTDALGLLSWTGKLDDSQSGRLRIRVPQMEIGEYTICLLPRSALQLNMSPSGECRTVYLAPYAEEEVSWRHSRTP